jgi:hypothetical protein
MNHAVICLLTLLFSLSSPAMEGNADFWQSSLAAEGTRALTLPATDASLAGTRNSFMTASIDPIFTPRTALVTWASGFTLVLGCMALMDALPWCCPVVLLVMIGGQTPLAAMVTKGKIRVSFPVNLTWVDILTAFLVPWVGPIFWYYQWKRAQENPTLLNTRAQWVLQRSRTISICLATFSTAAALFWIKLLLQD